MPKFFRFRIVWFTRPGRRCRITRRKGSTKSYLLHKESACKLVRERLEYFNQFYGFKYNKVAIRNQKTRWGSCSKRGNLNFSYKLALLPPHLADYIIVHELCHLKEFNHSQAFWDLVGKQILNYKDLRNQIKNIASQLST